VAAEYGGENYSGFPITYQRAYYGASTGTGLDRPPGRAKGKHDCVKNSALVGFAPPAAAAGFPLVS
jgi:hypothetical protein